MSTNPMNLREKGITNFSRVMILCIILFTIYPIIFVLLTSLKSTSEFYSNIWLWPHKLEWSNFPDAWNTAHIGSYFMNSIIVVSITVVITLIVGALAGYALARLKIPYAEVILFIILACTMVPSESVIMPMYLMTSKIKMTGTYQSLILPYIGWGLPMTIYIFRNFFKTLSNELLEAARIDGCTELTTFLKITAPLMLPATATTAILTFVGWWGELLWSSIELSTSSMKTIPMGIISFVSAFGSNWGNLSAAVCVILLPLVVFFLFTQKYFISGLTGGAVKG
jgi:raffinose/stachyose/melibiose transport system permease protein